MSVDISLPSKDHGEKKDWEQMPLGGGDGNHGGGVRVRLLDVGTGRLSKLKYKLVCGFELAADMFGATGSL